MSLRKIIGQDRAIDILKGSISQDRIAGGYLFLGPDSAGKRSTAFEFAKLLNCINKKNDSCGECTSCIKIDNQAHPDIFFIKTKEDESSISIKSIRQLQRRLSLKPFEARYKIAIIEDAQEMTDEAANSLLKMLEEPDSQTIFILTASSTKAILDTIVSRCQIIRFSQLSKEDVVKILIEDNSLEKEEASLLAVISGANIRKALELKEEEATSWKNELIDTFAPGKASFSMPSNDLTSASRQRLLDGLDIVLSFYRDILVYKYTKKEDLIMNIDRIDAVSETANNVSTEQIQQNIESIEKTRNLLDANVNTKLAIKQLQEKL